MTSPEPNALNVELHGKSVTIDDALKAGEATTRLLDTVSESLGAQVGWEVVSVQFKCDGCGLLRPDRPSLDEGWTHRSGDDFCPSCSGIQS